MIYTNVPEVIKEMISYSDSTLHALSIKAGVSYSTAHSWSTGKASPNVEKFNQFLNINGFEIKIVSKD